MTEERKDCRALWARNDNKGEIATAFGFAMTSSETYGYLQMV